MDRDTAEVTMREKATIDLEQRATTIGVFIATAKDLGYNKALFLKDVRKAWDRIHIKPDGKVRVE